MSLTSLNSNGLNFGGLITGIDPQRLINGLNSLTKSRVARLESQQARIRQRSEAIMGLQSQLVELQLNVGKLARSAGSAWDARKATSSDDAALAATAGGAATPGTYVITVESLAQADQKASAGFIDPNTRLRTGTLTVQSGSGSPVTVSIDERNNTLQGLADAINAAGSDVRASVINDGSATPFRLLLTAARSGAANTINVTNNLTSGSGAAIDPAAATLQAGADARVRLGSGSGAITVSSSTNQLNHLIPGVSIQLQRADAARPITLTVSNDTDAAATAIKDFVTSFNKVVDFIDQRDNFNSDENSAGVLLGNRDVQNLQNELVAALTASIPGLSTNANRLSSVGIALDDQGRLQLDELRLNQALNGANGVSQADLKRLFGMTGVSDTSGVQFQLATSRTQPSGPTPYVVNVTTAATRAQVVASTALAESIEITAANNSLIVKLNGLTSTALTLDAGTYTRTALAALLQQKINTNHGLSNNLAVVDLSSDRLRITSQLFGGTSSLSFQGGSALAVLGFSGTESSTGVNVAGEFLVNGRAEAATGNGQTLTGNSGNANTEGLQVRASLDTPGTANLTVTQGLAGRVNAVLSRYLDSGTGRLPAVAAEFQKDIDDIQGVIDKQNKVIREQSDRLTRQFVEMESAIGRLRGIGDQLGSLAPRPR